MGRLNPYVWGADSVRGVVELTRLHLSDDPKDNEKAEQLTREAEDRWNAKPSKSNS